MAVQRMDNVGIVVEDLDASIRFFVELGLTLEGRMPIEGEWAGRVTGLRGQRVEVAMMRTPDGHGRLELSRFAAPGVASDHRTAPVNSLGYLRAMFAVDDIDDTLARLGKLGATVVDEVVDYQDVYRLCYIRGPEGLLIGLAQQLGQQTRRSPATQTVETWIHGAEEMRPWCELIAEIVGYGFNDLDWNAVVAGMANADRHEDRWFECSFEGTRETIHLRMAYDIRGDNVAVFWEAPPLLHPEIMLATSIIQRFHLVRR